MTRVLIALLRGAWPLIVLISGGLFVAQFWFSDKITERAMGTIAGLSPPAASTPCRRWPCTAWARACC